MKEPLLVIIAGPTGVGKTKLAVEVAKYFKSEIISADSRQVYKEMLIGTAVPDRADLNEVPHHFIQTKTVNEIFNASTFEQEVITKLEDLFKRYRLLFMVGGSGMYIDAVCKGIDDLPNVPKAIRYKFKSIYEAEGISKLQSLVKEVDPIYYEQVDKKNHKRLLKALEIHEITGKPYSNFLVNKPKNRNFKMLFIILNLPREDLYNRINKRVDQMISSGLVDEVNGLAKYRHLTPLNTVGYKEIFDYLDNKITLDNAIELIKNHSRAYARRQLTWFRKYEDAHWFKPDDTQEIITLIKKKTTSNNEYKQV